MIERTLAIAAIAIGLLAGGCQEAAQPDSRGAGNPEKYDRDRSHGERTAPQSDYATQARPFAGHEFDDRH